MTNEAIKDHEKENLKVFLDSRYGVFSLVHNVGKSRYFFKVTGVVCKVVKNLVEVSGSSVVI